MTDRPSAYAEAIVALATAEGALDIVEDELTTVARTVEGAGDLRDRLSDTSLPVSQRLKFVEDDALAAAHPTTRAALAMIITAGRGGDLSDIANAVSANAAAARDREVAEVHVAAPIDAAKQEALRVALERATGKSLTLKVHVDPEVVGGVRAKVGDTVIDGSLASRLSEIRTRIAG